MIYIQRNGKEHGPYNDKEAANYLQNGQLLPNDLARTEGERGWRPLREVLASVPQASPQPAQSRQAVEYAVVPASPSVPAQPLVAAQPVMVVDIKMPFGSMVAFMIKWALASIPALIVLWIILAIFGLVVSLIFGSVFGGFSSMLQNR